MNRTTLVLSLSVCAFAGGTLAGPFAPAAGVPGSTAIAADSPAIRGWASGVVELIRGPQEIGDYELGPATFGKGEFTLGISDATPSNTFPVVSLGDGGSITLRLSTPIANGAGFDFAVFENALNNSFLELAFVEVSTNGVDFVRFPNESRTQTSSQINGDNPSQTFGGVDPTDVNNLAGKYRAGYGTPFNLSDLIGLPDAVKLDLNRIQYVRIIDVIGWIDNPTPARDSFGRIINDPWATPYDTSGFDLDAVAVLNTIPEPGAGMLMVIGGAAFFANRRLPRRRWSTMREAHEQSSIAAFTLMELLSVVAILSIVAVLTIAGVSAAREQADATQCTSNLKALVAANLAYAGDHEGQFVSAQEPQNLVRWHGVRSDADGRFDGSKGPLARYLGGEGRVKVCPSLKRVLSGDKSFEEGTGGYGYNAAYIGGTPKSTWSAERLGSLEQPARTVMFTDTAFPRAGGLQEYAYSEPWVAERPLGRFRGKLNASVHFRHGGRANVAWCDGRVSAEAYSQLDSQSLYGGDPVKHKIGWFGPSENNGYWRPY